MAEKKVMLNAEYIDNHLKDMSWLNSSSKHSQLEGLVANLLSEAKGRITSKNVDNISFPVNIEVRPYILGACIEIYINGFKVGHA
ncbi:hypothetical protein LT980_14505 [Citrobacter portucalensis]|uniref:hypothetical protein n=1 Tax=Citrobacter portucalensis TaxID=1639133 RepID=UPI00202CC01F|nr:hypothetical protein [Citrobacter portucalensis]URR11156.1 hypothetical protein LT980_14505 [Citrobacter portucalensis]